MLQLILVILIIIGAYIVGKDAGRKQYIEWLNKRDDWDEQWGEDD